MVAKFREYRLRIAEKLAITLDHRLTDKIDGGYAAIHIHNVLPIDILYIRNA